MFWGLEMLFSHSSSYELSDLNSIPREILRASIFLVIDGIALGMVWLWVAFERRYSLPKHILWNPDSNAFDLVRRKGLLAEELVCKYPTPNLKHPEQWRGEFYDWVVENIANQTSKPLVENEPIIVDLEQSFLPYPSHSDNLCFSHDFGKILRFRQDTQILATAVLQEPEEYHDTDVNISEPFMKPSFFGARLRLQNQRRHVSINDT
ncbi:hypothetical protein BJ875DRAFT_526820 [Amylocarpus encephaloides]|uniref:Uncharacterized protein n=1 Tax=Amylocarpus encephaloides TaxID=45428 RepID=A0A9P8C8I1_9HELO|nr:hypothetical protein BJ875DRAFT_526820 [Amylocarpus encephaloides]